MEQLILNLVNQYPILLYALIGVVVIMLVVAVFRGRGISFAGFKIDPGQSLAHSPPQIPLQQIFNVSSTPLLVSEEQFEEIANKAANEAIKRLNEKREEIKHEGMAATGGFLYQPPNLPEHVIYVYASRIAMEKKIKRIAWGQGVGWAGGSLASGRSFFEVLVPFLLKEQRMDERLVQDIRDFYSMTSPGPYSEFSNSVSISWFEDIQFLVTNIMRRLDRIPDRDIPIGLSRVK